MLVVSHPFNQRFGFVWASARHSEKVNGDLTGRDDRDPLLFRSSFIDHRIERNVQGNIEEWAKRRK